MNDIPLLASIQEAMKQAMRAKESLRLGTLRLILAAIKQKQIDARGTETAENFGEQDVIAVLNKMVKQRRDSVQQYQDAGRDDLAAVEQAEITIIEEFLPKALSQDEVASMIDAAIASTNASGPQDMGKVMGIIKQQSQGRADMGLVSKLVKDKLSS